jgi:hypothetical protein
MLPFVNRSRSGTATEGLATGSLSGSVKTSTASIPREFRYSPASFRFIALVPRAKGRYAKTAVPSEMPTVRKTMNLLTSFCSILWSPYEAIKESIGKAGIIYLLLLMPNSRTSRTSQQMTA